MSSNDITITLHNPQTGQSESMPLSNTLTLQEVIEFSQALVGVQGHDLVLTKDGKPLTPLTMTLAQAGVTDGDLLAVIRPRAPAPAPRPATGGGLDFSSLLGGAAASAPVNDNPTPFYYAGMTINDAMEANKHPKAFVKLLQEHQHLFKELSFHNPVLASKLANQPYERAVQIWREELVKGSISSAAAISNTFHKEREFTERLKNDPNDAQAKAYFEEKKRKQLVNEQYRQAMQEYPESMGRVLMLYIEAKINHHPLQAFVDSGAQMTIMSKKCAERCDIFHLVDTRFSGMAMGVGVGKILGKIHIVQLQIGDYYFPCSVTVMDDATMPMANDNGKQTAKPKDMDFLLGLDMLKRFNCQIDLGDGKLKFRLGSSMMETPFLHEKDLDESKGGTKGFDADRVNQEWMAAQHKYDKEDDKGNQKDDAMEEE
jgi:DNA damage-inducible protein 1